MIVDLPLTYEIDGVPQRGRSLRTTRVLDMVPVELEEVTFRDLDPVLRIRKGDVPVQVAPFRHGMTSDHPSGDRIGYAVEELIRLSTAVANRSRIPNVLYRFREQFQIFHGRGEEMVPHGELPTRFARIEWTDEQERRRRFHDEVVPNLFVLDGHLARVEREPVWCITSRGRRRAGMNAMEHHYAFAPGTHFRIDRMDLARSFALDTAGGIEEEPTAIDRLRDHDWTFSEIAACSETISRTLLWRLSEPAGAQLLRTADPAFLEAFVVMRDWEKHTIDARSEAAELLSNAFSSMRDVESWAHGLADALLGWTWISRNAPPPEPAVELAAFAL